MYRILIHEPSETHDPCLSVLAERGREIVICPDRETLVGAIAERRPDVIVYMIRDLAGDLGLLTSLRRLAPKLPMILVGGPTDLASRRTIQELRPTYYGVLPLDPTELDDAVRGALHRVTSARG